VERSVSPVRDIARRLRERIAALDPDQRAWWTLRRDGEVHPWTAAAEEAFGGVEPYRGTDDRVRHHRAICLHARAYDLQRDGQSAQALDYWRAALRDWAALHASDGFWARIEERMPPIDGRPVPHDVVESARRTLPRQLLDVHVALARALRPTAPALAAVHVDLIKTSGFPAADVAAARAALFGGLDARVAEAMEHKRFGPMFDEVVEWLRIDPEAPEPAHLVVALANGWAWRLWPQDNGWTSVGNMLRRVEEVLPAGGAAVGSLSDRDVSLLAYWRGVHLRYSSGLPRIGDPAAEIGRIRRANERAERHLREAMERSPDVRLHPWSIHHQLAEPLSVQAVCARMAGRDDDARRLAGEAVGLDPECTRAKELLDELGPPEEPLGPLDPIGREEVGMMPVELKKDLVSFDVAAIDRLLDSGEALRALERFEYLGQVADLVMVRELFADSTVLIRLAGVVAPHPARRRRFEAVLARLDDVTKGARG
jgi:hypothetical protein